MALEINSPIEETVVGRKKDAKYEYHSGTGGRPTSSRESAKSRSCRQAGGFAHDRRPANIRGRLSGREKTAKSSSSQPAAAAEWGHETNRAVVRKWRISGA